MMNMLETVRWELVSQGIQVVMWAVILGHFVRQRRKSRLSGALAETADPTPVFSQEVRLQTLRQQTEQALHSISAAVAAEREKLQGLLASADVPPLSAAAPIAEPAADLIPFRLGESDAAAAVPSWVTALKGFSARGLSPREIAAQMRMPVGEIELALRLQRGSACRSPAGTRQ